MTHFKKKIESLLTLINNRYKSNEILLERTQQKDLKDALGFKISYIRCGMPFFKDTLGHPAPENEDYKARKAMNEYFPFDHSSDYNPWKLKEKVALVKGVKKQMIEFIKSQQSQKVCQDKKTRNKIQKLRFISTNQDLKQMSMLDIFQTITKEYPDFVINWNIISFFDLHSIHSVTECMGMWYSYLKPDINREPFSDEENAILSHVVVLLKYQDWEAIAANLDRRTALQVFTYFYSSITRLCPPNIRWTPEEDVKLFEAVKKHTINGKIIWSKVGFSLDCRNKEQCYNRYLILTRYHSEKKGVFSKTENRVLLDYVARNGDDFKKMPKDLLPGRSIVQIKNHFLSALKHKGKVNPWVYEEDVKLMEFVEQEGPNWSKFANMIKTHNRFSCRTRHLTISKFLKNNPSKSLADVPSRLKTVTAVHKAILDDDEEEENNDGDDENEDKSKFVRTKTFGTLTFEEFQDKNSELYDVLKIAYNYNIARDDVNVYNQKFLILKSLLGVKKDAMMKKSPILGCIFTQKQIKAIKNALNESIEENIVKEIELVKTHTQFLLPPNYNTAMGLRAVTIKVSEEQEEAEKNPEKERSEKFKEELEKFQKMFFSLFYWTAMVAKIDSEELRESYLVTHSNTTFANFIKLRASKFSTVSLPLTKAPAPQNSTVKITMQALDTDANMPILQMFINPSATAHNALQFSANQTQPRVKAIEADKRIVDVKVKKSVAKKKAVIITNRHSSESESSPAPEAKKRKSSPVKKNSLPVKRKSSSPAKKKIKTSK